MSKLRIVVSNFSRPTPGRLDFAGMWRLAQFPEPRPRLALFDQPFGWGFHLYALGVYLMDRGVAERVEFWDYSPQRRMSFLANGVLKIEFRNEDDVAAYIDRFGPPDLFFNHGVHGVPVLRMLDGRAFRVHVPTHRSPGSAPLEHAECFLVDGEDQLEGRSMLYIPVVNTRVIRPRDLAKERDFIYLASCYEGKRHDLIVDAVRGTELTGHFHPVDPSQIELSATRITTSALDRADVVRLLQTSRIAVYPGDETSNPAAMWECVAAGLPIVVNAAIEGGKHVVVPGLTGELAPEDSFVDVMRTVLATRHSYAPREYFVEHWDTVRLIEGYLSFFQRSGWNP